MTKDERPYTAEPSGFRLKTKEQLGTGFTLLETIVALAIIIAAVIGPVVLVTSSLFSFGFSKNKLIALNLAQEGLELVRAIRENNVLCDTLNNSNQKWFENPNPGGGQMTNEIFEIDVIGTNNINCGSASLVMPRISSFSATKLRLNPATGVYSYDAGQETTFTREMRVIQPPDHEDLPGGQRIEKKDIREINSIVRWQERGQNREISLTEKLYNWR